MDSITKHHAGSVHHPQCIFLATQQYLVFAYATLARLHPHENAGSTHVISYVMHTCILCDLHMQIENTNQDSRCKDA